MYKYKGYEVKYRHGVRNAIGAALIFIFSIIISLFSGFYWFVLIGIVFTLIVGFIAKYWFDGAAEEKAEYERLQRENEQMKKQLMKQEHKETNNPFYDE
jgi:cell shape-determining protein MreC